MLNFRDRSFKDNIHCARAAESERVVPMYGSSFKVFTHFTHAHFIFLHNAVPTLWGGGGGGGGRGLIILI